MSGCLLVAAGLFGGWWWTNRTSPGDSFEGEQRVVTGEGRIEGAPMCPWRNPESDLAAFFPGSGPAPQTEIETRVLSGLRVELQRRLGRTPSAEENALQIHRVRRGAELLGNVIVRRVKGEAGAIEIVVATTPDQRVVGVRIQRQRESEEVAAVLGRSEWLGRFRGVRLGDDWKANGAPGLAAGEPGVASASAIVDGVRSLLVLLEMAEDPRARRVPVHHEPGHPNP